MTLDAYPVYRKDLRVLAKQAVAALLLQLILMIIVPVLISIPSVYNSLFDIVRHFKPWEMGLRDWFPKVQIAISAVIALAAAAQWSVEERAGQHDRFLRRLAASRKRIWGEKAAAGLTIVLGVVVLQHLWQAIALTFGCELWDPQEYVGLYIFIVATTAYLVGLPLSCIFNQAMGVVLVGLGIEFSGLWLRMSLGRHWASIRWPIVLIVLLLIVVPAISVLPTSRNRVSTLLAGLIRSKRENRSKIQAIVDKQVRENILLYGIALVLAVCGFVMIPDSPLSGGYEIILVMAMILHSAVLGVCVYNADDKDAVRCVLYHHPISRSTLFWTKFLTSLVPALLLSISISAMIRGPRPLGADIVAAIISVTACLLPFFCGLLTTYAFRNPFYAALGAALVTIGAGLFVTQLIFPAQFSFDGPTKLISEYISSRPVARVHMGPRSPDFSLFRFAYPLFLLVFGLVLAAWVAVRDRTVFAEGTFYRLVYMTRLLLFVIAVTLILTRVGWLDLFYLITSIDLGIG
ncbi:MAG TPA: hypothetical protein PLQ35_12515 [bacterium]|nr:hypothetical protein [bacterium]HQL63110.1 hypothetical protein [bacterium]